MGKKIFTLIMAAILLIGLSGCGGGASGGTSGGSSGSSSGSSSGGSSGSSGGSSGTSSAGNPENIIIATGNTSGTYYPLGGSIAQLLQDKGVVKSATAQSTEGSVANLQMISKGEVQLALAQNDIADYAVKGIEVFDKKLENISGIASLYPEIVQVVVAKDSDIKSIQDLKGKKVSVGSPGSGNEKTSKKVLEAAGLTYDDIQAEFKSYSDSADAFKDGLIDAAIVVAGIPNPGIQDVAVAKGVRVLNLDDELIAKLQEQYPFYVKVTVPKGTYDGHDEDANTIAVVASLIVRSDLSEDLVYNITKTLFENLDKITPKGDEIKLEKALDGMTVPVHPGAQKYYDEKGVKKSQ